MKVDCPSCGGLVEWTSTSRYRPFCSERCQLIDLGAWADEQYAIPTEESPPEFDLPPQDY